MSLVNNIDKVFQDNIAKNYEGLAVTANGVVINLNGLNIPLLDKNGKVVDNRLTELSEPIRRELAGQFSDTPSLMKAFMARANEEINEFFVQIANSWIDSLKAKVNSEQKILSIYEQRKMIDFLQDTTFKTKGQNKHLEIDEFLNNLGINLKAEYAAAPEIDALIQTLVDCQTKYQTAWTNFTNFLTLMKVMMDLTNKVERAAKADPALKSNALKNLGLINEITYDDMQLLPTEVKELDTAAQKTLLTTTITKSDLLQLVK